MKRKEAIQESDFEEPKLSKGMPQLAIAHLVDGKREVFRCTYESEGNLVRFEGVLTNPAELYALIDFLGFIGMRTGVERNEILAGLDDACECGANDWKLLSKVDELCGFLAGILFEIVQCRFCERLMLIHTGSH